MSKLRRNHVLKYPLKLDNNLMNQSLKILKTVIFDKQKFTNGKRGKKSIQIFFQWPFLFVRVTSFINDLWVMHDFSLQYFDQKLSLMICVKLTKLFLLFSFVIFRQKVKYSDSSKYFLSHVFKICTF